MANEFAGTQGLDEIPALIRSGQTQNIRILVYPLYLYKIMAERIPDDFYRIGSVAALTGIAVERLRAWERRHGFSPAHKSGRTRFYSADQLEKLKKSNI